MTDYIFQFHSIKSLEKTRADFNSDYSITDLILKLKLEGYVMYQYIPSDYTYNMSVNELKKMNIPFFEIEREVTTWFGFSKKIVADLLIGVKDDFFYPYQYGNYLYLFSKHKIENSNFEKWLNSEFPKRYSDLDDTFAGFNSEFIELINKEDYLFVTCHDQQEQLGITGDKSIINKLLIKLHSLDLDESEIEKYQVKSRKT